VETPRWRTTSLIRKTGTCSILAHPLLTTRVVDVTRARGPVPTLTRQGRPDGSASFFHSATVARQATPEADGAMDPNGSADRDVHATAQSLVEVAAGVMQTDAASLWRYDDDGAYLVARFPEDRMPTVKVFSEMPDLAASITAGETQLYVRDQSTGVVREWMETAGIAVSLRLPVESSQVERHFLGLSWERDDHPPVESLLPTARRLADHVAVALSRLTAERSRVESALELSDNVAQALTIAKASLHMGDQQVAEQAIERALDETQRIMARLMPDGRTADACRLYPSDVLGEAVDAEPSGDVSP
jgi:hypothetical protein